jgi:Spy/CpxP family protein refolding chaperone
MKPLRHLLIAAALLCTASGVAAQSPYAGLQQRPIKALSDQQIADLKAGRGMGMALPAELNGYPGPVHVLEFADPLGLTDAQRAAVQAEFAAMKAESMALGERLIEREAALDRLFAGRAATPDNVAAAVSAVAETQGELRTTHLKYHLSTVALLQPDLRGYGDGKSKHHHHH